MRQTLLAKSAIIALCLTLISAGAPRGAAQEDGETSLRVDLPLNGRLRVENQRGNINVEVWDEPHVAVETIIADSSMGAAARVSPVRIARAEELLTISVASRANQARAPGRVGHTTNRAATRRAPARSARAAQGARGRAATRRAPATPARRSSSAPPARSASEPRVDLRLRIPERTLAEIITSRGEITVRDVPAALTVRSVSGDIRLEFADVSDTVVTAETASGSIVSTVTGTEVARAGARGWRARWGTGSRTARLQSASGLITLASLFAGSSAPGGSTGARQQTARARGAATDNVSANDDDVPVAQPGATQPGQPAAARRPPSLIGSGRDTDTRPATTPQPSPTPQEVGEDDIIEIDTELVTINVSVVDRGSGRGIAGLAQNDFRVFEDNAEQQLEHFESAQAPFNLALLIDLSGSTTEVVNLIRGAALRFVAAARPQDRIAVITFANTPVLVSPLTTDRAALRARISAIEQPRGSTKLYDALSFTLDMIEREAAGSRRSAIVLMSDGLDSALPNVQGEGSTLAYSDLLNRAREFDGVLYSLWLDTEYESISEQDVQPETFDLAHDHMRELAEAGGGVFYEVQRLEDLAGVYERVVADLGTVYSLSYRPTNRARTGNWRAIRVTVARPNAVARGRRGYRR